MKLLFRSRRICLYTEKVLKLMRDVMIYSVASWGSWQPSDPCYIPQTAGMQTFLHIWIKVDQLVTLALLSTAQHVSDVNTSIFRSLRLFVALCRLTWGVLVLCSGIVCWWCIQCRLNHYTTPGYHITNRQSRYITPARLKSAYTTQQVVDSSWRWTY